MSFLLLLIVVEGAKTPPKMLPHFHRAWAGSKKPIQCPAGIAGQVRPRRSKATRRLSASQEELLFEKAGSWAFSLFFQRKAKRLERKSTV
ncbi:hypothetical protein J7E38_23530 [Bacillus sp. ISL-35]|uniref:hypothetical protein n=1 Tax=Bacillus sp. ISL-35 TaxID=2819122 RepID=UPI001BE99FBD|nr:hypothetical protein [Bacillus sp. ISL-35]MBT2681936.1 hypothetical protein [Bacillus sp. ISL-35]MBT2702414.1 hypothetical protein [Chryseobacterium sp. ISL-80]